MTQNSRSTVKSRIIEELQRYHNQYPNGTGMPSKNLEKKVGLEKSPNTFAACKYELERDHAIETGKYDSDDKRKNLVRLVTREAQIELAFQEALQEIQKVASHKIGSQQSQLEYLKFASSILVGGLMDDGGRAKAYSLLSKQPHVKTAARIAQLVQIAHVAVGKIGFGELREDAYLRVCLSSPAETRGLGLTKPVRMVDILPYDNVEALRKDSRTLDRIRIAAAKNSTLARLLNETEPELGFPERIYVGGNVLSRLS